MTNEKLKEIDNYCSLCMDINCDGCEYQDIHFRDLPYYKPKNKNKMKTGAELISDERQRQIKVEGWTAEHDSQHETEEFIKAALSYLMANVTNQVVDNKYIALLGWWPWDKEFFKPKDIKSDLVRAGALVAAALDRLQTDNTNGMEK